MRRVTTRRPLSFVAALGVACLFSLQTSSTKAIEVGGTLLVDLKAENFDVGSGVWFNDLFATTGDFNLVNGPGELSAAPGGTMGVRFNGGTIFQGDNAPASITGAGPSTIEVWVLKAGALDAEDTMVGWGHRGGPDRTNMSFNYGNHGAFGAVGHWGGGGDVGWVDAGGNPGLGQWHLLAYTYDGVTTKVFDDGVLANQEDQALNIHPNTGILIGSQWDNGTGGLNTGLTLNDSWIGQVRIHDEALSEAQLLSNFNEEVDNYSAQDPDGHLPPPPPPPLFLTPADPAIGVPVIYNNRILFEMRGKPGGAPAPGAATQAEIYRLNDDDTDNDGVPDDPNVLLQDGMHVLNTNNVDAGNVYGAGWTSGNPTTGTMVQLDGTCCVGNDQQDNLVMVNEFQFYDADGRFEFTENFDDGVHISVNGNHIHNDRGWNVRTNAVWDDDDQQGGGWYDIVVHGLEDGGGAASAGGIAFGVSNTIGAPEGDFQALIPGYSGDAENGVSYRAVLDTIPEPTSVTLALIGLCGLAFGRRRPRS